MTNDFDDFDDDNLVVEESETQAPAAEGSVLSSIRDRVKKAKENLHTDLEVPRLDPPVFVRYRPVTQARLNAANKAAQKTSDKNAEVIANAGILVEACIGVYEVIDGEEVSVDPDDRNGEWPRFDKHLASILELSRPGLKASDVVRGLYLTDGDVISTVTKLGVWSGYAQEQLERDPSGN